MHAQEIHTFLHQFFKENHCEVLHGNEHYLTVQLTIDMDKKIMNRPFYWRYVESVNETPNPAQLTLITDMQHLNSGIKGEAIHLGSPRLHQLFRVTKEMGRYVKMYERISDAHSQVILTPWIGVNYKVSFISHQTKEMLYSIGMNLMTGAVMNGFHETLCTRQLSSEPSEQVFHLPYIITPARGIDRLDQVIDQIIEGEDQSWIEEAEKRWKRDQAVLDYFYEGQEQKPEYYDVEKQAMEERFKPRITVDIVSGGLFYLK
ncbi:hypothetical protein SporoP37_06895 [Sporosarcina sp. P37]|uniref:YqhG family protein n=1 Tax=unclassified Sporosarcina TaxID=2647733 RepID=UPI000A17C977|nr:MULTISPECIES: YqhG family protein [unclassified Sporosarcina]ARK24424.1 hypothetical protein SporoP37_06895 [Sporosarcina sp. P37]PID17589.1 hypothetical protein CSV62_12785 [Sporosarcina sp. P35]